MQCSMLGHAQVETMPDGYRRTPRGDLVVPCRSVAAAGAAAARCAHDSPGVAIEQGVACSSSTDSRYYLPCQNAARCTLEAHQTSLGSVQEQVHRA
jgi:hypothetical protein